MWNKFVYFISNAAGSQAIASDCMMVGGAELESVVVVIANYKVLFAE